MTYLSASPTLRYKLNPERYAKFDSPENGLIIPRKALAQVGAALAVTINNAAKAAPTIPFVGLAEIGCWK